MGFVYEFVYVIAEPRASTGGLNLVNDNNLSEIMGSTGISPLF